MKNESLVRGRKQLRQSGFTLMELLIVMSVILILMAVAIPNYMNMRSQANETAAMEELRTLNSAEIQYQTDYPANGFSCNLSQLGGDPKSGPPSAQAAQLIPSDLASGYKSGYLFAITNCTKVNVNNQDVYTSFEVTAVPQSVGKTGHRGFCMDQTGEVKADPAGGTNCTQPIS
ncbi:MAG TPA: type II secretion system protein [Acidobacteriaceae bacterium]|nr:type II secretion system protein [Acidobacteriaceae bacterium]